MARKFEVGQKVRIREWDDMKKEFGVDYTGDIETFPIFVKDMKHLCGRTATITCIREYDRYLGLDRCVKNIVLKFDDTCGNVSFTYSTDMIEPCFPTFEELVGKVIETRDGRRYLGVDTKDKGIIFCNYCGWFAASDRNENLLSRYHKDNDIMKVYKPECCKGCTLNSILEYVGTIIWERIEEEPIKEMTVADVEKLVGTKVKIVKEA